MTSSSHVTRRDALRQMLLFSAALAAPRFLAGQTPRPSTPKNALHLFCLGDWGAGVTPNQIAVASAMQAYAKTIGRSPEALFLLGDNFYGALPDIHSPRWKKEFEDMYPASVFPGPCHAILGNHDYDDQPDGERIQMDYARTPGTRWRMPARWYRLDLPAANPVATFLCVDTHFAKLNERDIASQDAWLKGELARPRRTPWMFVCGHHPVFSVGTQHGDTKRLGPWAELFHEQKVHAYICGHEHDLQHLRMPEKSTDWFISGGGGRELHAINPAKKASFAQSVFGFMHLSVTPHDYEMTFVGQDAGVLYTCRREPAQNSG